MRRAAPLIVLAALALPAAAQAQAPPLRAKLAACQSGPPATARTATFVGSMPAIAGTKRMWMRFDLFARVAAGERPSPPSRRRSSACGRSRRPGASSSGFVFTQRVAGADRAGVVPRAGALPLVRQGRQAAALGHAHERDLQAARPAPGPARRRARRRPRARCPTRRRYALDVAQRRPHGGRPVRRRAHRRRRRAAGRARSAGSPPGGHRRPSPSWRRAARPASIAALRPSTPRTRSTSRARSTTSSSAPARWPS